MIRITTTRLAALIMLLAGACFGVSQNLLPKLGETLDAEKPKAVIEATISPAGIAQSASGTISVTFKIPKGYHQIFQEEYFRFDVSPVSDITFGDLVYPKGETSEGVTSFYDTVTLKRSITVNSRAAPGLYTFAIEATSQLCNEEGECFFPETNKLQAGMSVVSASIDFGAILWYLLLAFAGGIILNLMPCVLPVLSIKALAIVRQKSEDKSKSLAHGLLYSSGIIASMIVIAIATVSLKLSGELVGWGFQFQDPLFVSILLVVTVLLALSMFEVFVFNPPPVSLAGGRGKGLASSFAGGIYTVLIAIPCTAPFLGVASGFALTQPPPVIVAIFTSVGLGLSLPFFLVSIFPAVRKLIPKSGEWTVVFREVMGFLLLATAVFLLFVLSFQLEPDRLTGLFALIVIVSFSAWIYGKAQKSGLGTLKKTSLKAASVLAALVSAFFLIGLPQVQGSAKTNVLSASTDGGISKSFSKNGWEIFSEAALESYRAEGYPAFLVFGAKWCLTCLANEAMTLESADIKSIFEEKGVKVLYGDYTKRDPLVSKWIAMFGRGGVPVYALYLPGEEKPVLFPEIITKGMIKEAF